MEAIKKLRIFNGNTLKLLAAITMLIDHIGIMFFPNTAWLRVIGRLSMPIFAFMISEGCRYTRNKWKHFLLLFGLGAACQIVYIIFAPSTVYLGILITFSLSTLIIYSLQYAKKKLFDDQTKPITTVLSFLLLIGLTVGAYLLCKFITVDYGFWGVMMPVFASIFDFHRIPAPDKIQKFDLLPLRVLCMSIPLCLLIATHKTPLFPLPALLALPLLLLYSGKKGKANLKYFFYVFYPAHLGILQGILFILLYFGT